MTFFDQFFSRGFPISLILYSFLVPLLLLFISIILYYLYMHGNDSYWPKKNVPLLLRDELISIKDQFFLKFRAFEIDHMIYNHLRSKNLKFCGLMEFRRPILYIRDLDLIKNILVKDFEYFVNHRKEKGLPKSNPAFCVSFGLLLLRNNKWKKMRSIMTPAYSTLKIKRMFQIFTTSGNGLNNYIKNHQLGQNNVVNMTEAFRRILIHTTCSVAFGIESKSFDKEPSIYHTMAKTFEFQFHGFGFVKIYPILLIGKRIVQAEHMRAKVINFFKNSIAESIKYRKENGIKRDDFLQILLETREEFESENKTKDKSNDNELELTDDVIFAQLIIFFLAGYINVVVLLVYTVYELAFNPECQDRLRSEVRKSFEKNNGELAYEQIQEMKYLDMVITETMRKYSTSGGGVRLERECTKDYKMPGSEIVIPKGTVVIIPNHSIHNDPEIYPNPEVFDPSRWEEKNNLHSMAYMPFGIGPRVCIAQRYALIQAKTCIAQLVNKFEFRPSPKTPFPMEFSKKGNAMRPAADLFLTLNEI